MSFIIIQINLILMNVNIDSDIWCSIKHFDRDWHGRETRRPRILLHICNILFCYRGGRTFACSRYRWGLEARLLVQRGVHVPDSRSSRNFPDSILRQRIYFLRLREYHIVSRTFSCKYILYNELFIKSRIYRIRTI